MRSVASAVVPRGPAAVRFRAYLRGRFPVGANGVMTASYVVGHWALAAALASESLPVRVDSRLLAAVGMVFLFFFHLRVLDEHKDREHDGRVHPERPVPSGLVSLRELRAAGVVAVAAALALAAAAGRAPAAATAAAFVYSLAMLKEFFVPRWLRAHFVTYALSHLLVLPLLSVAVYSFATATGPRAVPPLYWAFAAGGYCAALGWETARKTRAPGDEVAGEDSYSVRFGTSGAAAVCAGAQVVAAATAATVSLVMGLGAWPAAGYAATASVGIAAAWRFSSRPQPHAARALARAAALNLIAYGAGIAGAVAAARGVEVLP